MEQSTYAAAGALVLSLLILRWYLTLGPNLDAIPAVGHPGRLTSYITAFRFVLASQSIIDEGYTKFKGGLFKVPMLDHWLVVATDTRAVEDIRKAPDDVLSFEHALFVFLQTDWTVGPQLRRDPYHTALIRAGLTRSLAGLADPLHDELVRAFRGIIPAAEEWTRYPAAETLMRVVCQTSNRVFVGAPLCRDADFQELNIQFTLEIVKAAVILKLFPDFLKPLAALAFSNVRSCTRRCARHIEPLVNARRARQRELGDGEAWEKEKPNDMLMWCMDAARGDEQEIEKLALRILLINFGAIHTTSMTLVFALYRLAANPEHAAPLRADAERALAAHGGWTKRALDAMPAVESFLKEVLRIDATGIWAMQRLALRPFTFSNGATVPRGTMLAVPVLSVNQDPVYHPRARTFDPWRFLHSQDQHADEDKGADDKEHTQGYRAPLAATQPEYLSFGHGKHACPGRFFAAVELKAMLAHVVLTYDVRFPPGTGRPPNDYLAAACLPGKADLEFRKRAAAAE